MFFRLATSIHLLSYNKLGEQHVARILASRVSLPDVTQYSLSACIVPIDLHVCTVFPRIEAGVSISFVRFLTRPLNEAGLYSGEASNTVEPEYPVTCIRRSPPLYGSLESYVYISCPIYG